MQSGLACAVIAYRWELKTIILLLLILQIISQRCRKLKNCWFRKSSASINFFLAMVLSVFFVASHDVSRTIPEEVSIFLFRACQLHWPRPSFRFPRNSFDHEIRRGGMSRDRKFLGQVLYRGREYTSRGVFSCASSQERITDFLGIETNNWIDYYKKKDKLDDKLDDKLEILYFFYKNILYKLLKCTAGKCIFSGESIRIVTMSFGLILEFGKVVRISI